MIQHSNKVHQKYVQGNYKENLYIENSNRNIIIDILLAYAGVPSSAAGPDRMPQ